MTGMLWPRDAVARPARCTGPCSCAKGSAVRRQVGHLLTRAGLVAALAILESCTWSGLGMTGRTDIDAAIIRQWYSDKRQLIRLRWPGYDTTLCCTAALPTGFRLQFPPPSSLPGSYREAPSQEPKENTP